MYASHPPHLDPPVKSAIRRIVGRASRGSGFVRAGEHAYQPMKAHPSCGLTGREMVDAIVLAATKAGVAVEMSRPQNPEG